MRRSSPKAAADIEADARAQAFSVVFFLPFASELLCVFFSEYCELCGSMGLIQCGFRHGPVHHWRESSREGPQRVL